MKRIKPAADPQYGRRLNWHEDRDFRAFLTAHDWGEPECRHLLDPRHWTAFEALLSCQGDYQGDVSPLRHGRILTEAGTEQAALPLVLLPAHESGRSVRIATQGHWRRRLSFREGSGGLVRSFGSEGEWSVSLRASSFGFCVYLKTLATPPMDGKSSSPRIPARALDGMHRDRPLIDQGRHADFLLVDVGDGVNTYVAEVLFVPVIAAARALAVRCAWFSLHPFPHRHPPPARYRWMRIYGWRDVVSGERTWPQPTVAHNGGG